MAIEKLRKSLYLCRAKAVIAQLVERQLPKLQVAGSNPVYRSKERQEVQFYDWTFLFYVVVNLQHSFGRSPPTFSITP